QIFPAGPPAGRTGPPLPLRAGFLLCPGPIPPWMVFERVRAQRRQLDNELLAHRRRERRGDPDMVERVIVVVQAEQERADHRAGALLVPAEGGGHAISRALVLHLDHRAFPGAIGRVETLCHDTIEPGALEAAEPVRRKRSIARSRGEGHRRLPPARAVARVAGERCTGGAAPANTCWSRSRRTARGALRRSSSPSASRSQATNEAGACAESSFTRDAAGWMRKSRVSKSSPPTPAITISPSTTQRSDSVAASGAMSSGKYRFMGFSSRLCSRISSPSRNTSVRKPSHLGSNCHPSPPGKASAALDNMGARGGAKGRRMAQYSRKCFLGQIFLPCQADR